MYFVSTPVLSYFTVKTKTLAIAKTAPAWLPAVLLAVLSLSYYALYADAGFNFSDEGNYAQFAYELSLGTSLSELPVSYGLLWFKVGEILFRVFGPDYGLIRILFFACVLATTLLVYTAIMLVTGKQWFAAAVAAVPALAPAFLPTAFYGICILINCVPQIRFAQRLNAVRLRDAALAGAALAVSFQIRPDFGYIFAAPLAILIALAAYQGAKTRNARAHLAMRLMGAALSAFVVLHIPGLLFAINDGYVGTLFTQYLSYPVMLANYGIAGVKAMVFGAAVDAPAAGTLLTRPGLFSATNFTEWRLGFLVYLPVFVIIGFLIYNVAILRLTQARITQGAVMLVVLVTGVAALPHYFFYRPDLSHIANFMPGFAVLAGIFSWQAVRRDSDEPQEAISAAPFVAAAIFGFYLWAGLATEGTGSIAGSSARTELFEASNGVKVRVRPDEKALLDDLKAVIEARSKPGDAIVCVPYCPGIAFMTGRRLLFREQYVDDGLPLRDPTWLPRAIAATQEKRPPVVIVMDWAINGTDISRFSRWAAPYMEALENLAREKHERAGYTIYLL